MRKINSPFELNGKGLHSGKDCSVKIEPFKSDFIIMRSYESGQELPINKFKTQGTGRGSDYIFKDETKIRTCEHVLSGLNGLGLFKDVKITVKGGEMPALDGCSHEISSEILKHSEEFESDIDFLSFNSPFIIHDEKNKSRFIAYFPDSELDKLLITYAVDYQVIGAEIFDFEYTPDNYYNTDPSVGPTLCYNQDGVPYINYLYTDPETGYQYRWEADGSLQRLWEEDEYAAEQARKEQERREEEARRRDMMEHPEAYNPDGTHVEGPDPGVDGYAELPDFSNPSESPETTEP